jgi:folate-binding protein YgfZ
MASGADASLREALLAAREGCALRSGFAPPLCVEGPDARDFLHRLTSQNVKNLAEGQAAWAALLNRQGQVQAFFVCWRTGAERFHLLGEAPDIEAAARLLETGRFRERLQIASDPSLETLVLAGPRLPAFPEGVLSWSDPLSYPPREARWILADKNTAEGLKASMPRLNAAGWEVLRITAGLPSMEKDLREGALVLEANMEFALARNKGCYPGQEIVERIYSKGNVARLLIGLSAEGATPLPPGCPVSDGGKEAGSVSSSAYDPLHDRSLALAWIQKGHWESGGLAFRTPEGSRPAALLPNRYSKK